MRESIYYIYRVVNNENGKSYVGWTNDPEKRWKQHIYAANSGKVPRYKLHEAILEEGINKFKFDIIYCSKDRTHVVTEMESYFILNYNTIECGYNSTKGGQGNLGWNPSKKTRILWSEQRKGKIITEEHRKKLSIALKLNPPMRNPETRKKVSETLKRKGIQPVVSKEKRIEMNRNKIGKPIHTKYRKEQLSKQFKQNNPMHDPIIREKARRNKKGKATGKNNGNAVFAKVIKPDGTLLDEGYLRDICEMHGLPFDKFLKNSRYDRPLMRGEWKGWNIVNINKC